MTGQLNINSLDSGSLEEELKRLATSVAAHAGLFGEPDAYRAGVEDAIDRLRIVLPKWIDRRALEWVRYTGEELTGPLSLLRSVVETVGAQGRHLDQAEREELHTRAVRQLQLIERVLYDLQRLYQLTSDQITVEPRPLNVTDLLRAIISDCVELLHPAVVTVETSDQPLFAVGDPATLSEIVANLLRNVREHAPCHDPLLVGVEADDDTVTVSVHDDGPAISPDGWERTLERDTAIRDRVGRLGLDLYVARALARRLSGDIGVGRSAQLGGTRFDLHLPRYHPLPSPTTGRPVHRTADRRARQPRSVNRSRIRPAQ